MLTYLIVPVCSHLCCAFSSLVAANEPKQKSKWLKYISVLSGSVGFDSTRLRTSALSAAPLWFCFTFTSPETERRREDAPLGESHWEIRSVWKAVYLLSTHTCTHTQIPLCMQTWTSVGRHILLLLFFSVDANTLQILHRWQKRLKIWGEISRTNMLHLFVIWLCYTLMNYFYWSCPVTQKLTERAHFKDEYEHFSGGFDPLNMCVGQILNDSGLETVLVEFTWDVFAQLVYLTNTCIFLKTSVIPSDMSVSMCGFFVFTVSCYLTYSLLFCSQIKFKQSN